MASSKSHRASVLPNLSFPSLRSSSAPPVDSDNASQKTSSSSSRTLKKLRRQSIVDRLPPQVTGRSAHSSRQSSPVREEAGSREPVPPPPMLNTKSKTWSHRISSLLPSLTPDDSDPSGGHRHTSSLPRRPVGSNSISGPPPPADSAPPPPYEYSSADHSSPVHPEPSMSEYTLPYRPPSDLTYGDSITVPQIRTQIPNFSFSTRSHQASQPAIMAHPPPPEPKRATLTKQEPAAARGSQQNSPSTIDSSPKDDSPRNKLQKEAHENRARRNSIQNPTIGQANSNLQAAVSGNIPEQRGRRAVSAQIPQTSAPEPGNPNRVSSYPISASSRNGSSERGEQSPSRGRLRRSWLPGSGGRSRSNSADVTGRRGTSKKPYAWIMTDGPQTDYNPAFLQKGEKVWHFATTDPLAHF